MKQTLTSAEAANLVGVTASTIKRWVDQGRIDCVLTPGGHRRISREAIERFLQGARAPRDSARNQLLDLLLDVGESHRLQSLLIALRAELGNWADVADVVAASLRDVGVKWRQGSISIAQEHAASQKLQQAIFACASALPSPPPRPSCLLAAVEGDQHTLGLTLADICLREAGWSVRWLGSPTPTFALLDAIDQFAPDMVAISASEASSDAGFLSRQYTAIEGKCRKSAAGLILAGGGPWPDKLLRAQRIWSFRDFAKWLTDFAPRSELAGKN